MLVTRSLEAQLVLLKRPCPLLSNHFCKTVEFTEELQFAVFVPYNAFNFN